MTDKQANILIKCVKELSAKVDRLINGRYMMPLSKFQEILTSIQ